MGEPGDRAWRHRCWGQGVEGVKHQELTCCTGIPPLVASKPGPDITRIVAWGGAVQSFRAMAHVSVKLVESHEDSS